MLTLVKFYSIVAIGGIIQGFAMSVFLFPHFIPSGGAGGAAVLLNYWFGVPLGVALWLVNFSLLVVAIKWLGNKCALGTMFGITIASLSINFFDLHIYKPMGNVWIDLFFGAIFLGIGVGILLRKGVSNGGVGVIALLLATYFYRSPGRSLFVMNGFIFILTGSVIAWEIVFQALICQWVSTRVVDLIYNMKVVYRLPGAAVQWRKNKK